MEEHKAERKNDIMEMQKGYDRREEKSINTFRFDALFALQQTIPVMLGYLCLGIAFGLMLQNAGYHFLWAFCASLLIYAGSMQFLLVTLLTGGASLIYAAIMTFFINGRQIFYGLSLIDRFKSMGKFYPYMIFSLTDETYSLMCSVKIPKHLDSKRTMFLISLFDHLYWITGSVIGALAGELIKFDTTGVDFSMTALFIVIVLNQWKESRSHISAITGFTIGIIFLILLGAERFLVPSLAVVSLLLIFLRGKIKEREVE